MSKGNIFMRGRDIEIGIFHEKRNIDTMATRATNMGIFTVESMVGNTTMFFEDDKLVIGTPFGFMAMSTDKAETLAKEILELIPMYRQDRREGRTPMDSRSIGKMLERDFA